jgi:hypothetical protein
MLELDGETVVHLPYSKTPYSIGFKPSLLDDRLPRGLKLILDSFKNRVAINGG